MKVFVAGSTGLIGRILVPLLLDAGHEVVALARARERAAGLEARGAEIAVADALDARALEAAVLAARPDVIVNMLTALGGLSLDQKGNQDKLDVTSRLRREATATLARAARAAGATRLISQGGAFVYRPGTADLAGESTPLWTDAGDPWGGVAQGFAELERITLGAGPVEGVVLRFGSFYGPGSSYAPGGAIAGAVGARKLPIVAGGRAVTSFIHLEDAAASVLAALTGPPGVYNVVDDDPAPASEWIPALAAGLGAAPPRRLPRWVVRLMAGEGTARYLTSTVGASNARARDVLGWTPVHPSWRPAFAEGARDTPRAVWVAA